MGKKSRQKRRSLGERISVFDAAEVVELADQVIQHATLPGWGDLPPSNMRISVELKAMMSAWRAEAPVVLRIDDDFAQALAGSRTDVELVDDWLGRMPYEIFVGSLSRPLVLHDGSSLNRYHGFIASGSIFGRAPRGFVQAHPRPFAQGDGFMVIWLFRDDMGFASAQTVSWYLRGPYAKPDVTTLGGLIAAKREDAGKLVCRGDGRMVYAGSGLDTPAGDELPTLIPLTVQLLLYLASRKPDLEKIPPQRVSRPHQLRDAEISDLGWRVGAAFRAAGKAYSAGTGTGATGVGLPPHMRSAHWHRFRHATRDEQGRITGDRLGVQGVDWHYELEWLPPIPVNIQDGKAAPVVRKVG